MLFVSELFGLLSRHLPSAAICFMSEKTNLYIYITFFSKILEPIGNMIESGSPRDIKHNKSSIHVPIVT